MTIDYFFQILEPLLLVLGLASLGVALLLMWIKRRPK
jgi:hypothetical protein